VAAVVSPDEVLGLYREGVQAVCLLAGELRPGDWTAPTPCTAWRAEQLAGHLRSVAAYYQRWLDQALDNDLARMMAGDPPGPVLEQALARYNAAALAALPAASGPEHIAAFRQLALAYARRLPAAWEQPFFAYRGRWFSAGDHAGVAAAEWHLHAWDLASSASRPYRPADPGLLAAAWTAGVPHLALGDGDPWEAILVASGRPTTWASPPDRTA